MSAPARRATRPEDWLRVTPQGLYCEPGGFHIDPHRAVERALITHGHSDHARPGHRHVLTTPETAAIVAARYGPDAAGTVQRLRYGEALEVGGARVRLEPAGHILGSAQAVIEYRGQRIVVSGDYKREPDPTCPAFVPVPCDVFVTEATFALPVFCHPPAAEEVAKLLASVAANPDRCHLVGVYNLGKCQRLIRLLREGGHDRTIWLHGGLAALCDLYEARGVPLGDRRTVAADDKKGLAGEIVLCPPSAANERWARGFPEPVVAMASGWMRIRQRARQRGAELPLVISDHADWDGLTRTIEEVGAPRVWVTHGREEALVHWARRRGFDAAALSLVGYEDEDDA